MQADDDTIYKWVDCLAAGDGEEQYQAALALRAVAGDAGDKHLIREAGGIEALLQHLDSGNDNMLTVVAAETLSCLAADDPANRASKCNVLFCLYQVMVCVFISSSGRTVCQVLA